MKNYLVIGGSSGIGKSIVAKLIEKNHSVFATYNDQKIQDKNGVEFHHLNVLDESYDLDFLPDELHGIAYCPGSIYLKPFHRLKDGDFIEDFKLQTLGAVRVLQRTLSKMKAAENASVVLFSTVAVQHGFNFHSLVATSKGSIEGLCRSLSAEWAPNIRVNCIAPSLTDTPLAAQLLSSNEKREANAQRHPLKKIGKAEDIANAAVFLLDDDSSWITGQVMTVDGGISAIR